MVKVAMYPLERERLYKNNAKARMKFKYLQKRNSIVGLRKVADEIGINFFTLKAFLSNNTQISKEKLNLINAYIDKKFKEQEETKIQI